MSVPPVPKNLGAGVCVPCSALIGDTHPFPPFSGLNEGQTPFGIGTRRGSRGTVTFFYFFFKNNKAK
jgi:hypothetical protein